MCLLEDKIIKEYFEKFLCFWRIEKEQIIKEGPVVY